MVTIVHLKLRLPIRSRVTIKTLIFRKIFKMFHNNILVVMIAGLLMTLINLNSTLAKIKDQMTSITSLRDMACQVVQKKLEEKSDSLDDNIISGFPSFSAITPDALVLSTEEPDNSLSMGDEHLDTIPTTESDEFIKSGVENLIPIPSEFEGIPEHVCDVPFHDNSPPLDVSKDQIEDFSESNEEFSSIDDDYFSIDDIDYVEASPPDSELVSSEVMEIIIPEVGGIDDDILLTIKDDILREKLLNVNLLISKIEALNANSTPSFDCKTKSSSTSLNSLSWRRLIPLIILYPSLKLSALMSKRLVVAVPLLILIFLFRNMKFQPSSESLFAYVVWISLPFLVYSVVPHYLLSLRNEDIIFDPGICKLTFSRPDISHR
nr:hypothetical protein [Tanacetum cinerariifolium]